MHLGLRTCVVVILMSISCAGAAPPPTTQPTAAALIRQIHQSELWFDGLTSFRIRAESRWTRTPASVERRRLELKAQFPDIEPDVRQFPDLAPESSDTFELAAVAPSARVRGGRLLKAESLPIFVAHCAWDGARQVNRTTAGNRPADYMIRDKPAVGVARDLLANFSWGRTAAHRFWWTPEEARPYPSGLRPDNFTLAGRTNYRGTDCHVLESDVDSKTLYIGVADNLLYGLVTSYLHPEALTSPAKLDALLAALSKHFGREFKSIQSLEEFIQALPADRKPEVDRAIRPFRKPSSEHWMADYRDAPPGKPFPMTQGYTLYEGVPGGDARSSRTVRVTSLELNPDLLDSLFTIEIPEGVRVYDAARDVSYTQKKDRSPADWQAINDEVAERNAIKKARADLVGQPAPPFPADAQWLHATALTLGDLKGKVVLVDFFADWCGPCRADLPTLANLHNKADEIGITVLAIHPPGSDQANIDKVIKTFNLTYPICIDTPDPANVAWGALYAQYHVHAIPYTFLIDRDGRIVAHGPLAETLPRARELASK